MSEGIEKYSTERIDLSKREEFLKHVFYHSLSSLQDGNYTELKERLNAIDRRSGTGGNCIYYLSWFFTISYRVDIYLRKIRIHCLIKGILGLQTC